MASFVRAVFLFAAASCAALLLAASAASSRSPPPAVYGVGGETGWAVPPPPPGNGAAATQALSEWAMAHRFLVGDVLDFKHSSSTNDSVLLVRRRDYERCRAASPVRRFTGGGGGTRVRLDRAGLFYFIGGAPARCEAGQRMAVRVVDGDGDSVARASSPIGIAPAPAPAPGTEALLRSGAPPAHHRSPMPLRYKMFAAAAIGFGAGCVFVLLVLWVCVCYHH